MNYPLLRSTSVRLAVAVAASFLCAIALLGSGVYFAVSTLLDNDARQVIRADADSLLAIRDASGMAGLQREIARRTNAPDDPEAVYALLDAKGHVLAGAPVQVPPSPARVQWLRYRESALADSPRVLVQLQPIASDRRLLTGLQTRSQDGFLTMMLHTALIALVVAAALGVLLGWGTSRWVSYRLRDVDDTAARVGHGELDLRVPRNGSGDAFDRLAQRFNAMLDRIEELMHGIRHATDYIAHDLRTPLTRVRNRLDQMREDAHAAQNGATQALDATIAETDQLLESFAALLRLSRIEEQGQASNAPPVELHPLVCDALDLYAPIASEQGLVLHQAIAPAAVRGDADQLFQVMVNLLDNALKHAPAGALLEVVLKTAGQQAILEVADHGPGIPSDQLERVFDRFVRLQPDRGTSGTGLGLSVVRAIVHRHRGSLELLDNAPGLRVRVQLPLA